jgi:hypothetical protein
MQRSRLDAGLVQRAGQRVGAVLGAGEDQHLMQAARLEQMQSRSFFCSRLHSMTRWVTVSAAVLRGATSTETGWCSRPLASSRISGEKVAENIRF